MDAAAIQAKLNAHGFPCGRVDGDIGPRTRQAVAHYQAAWAGLYGADGFGWLTIDGIPGPHTQRCLEKLPALSWHFTTHELRSKGNGDCYVRRELVAGLEHLRGLIGPFAPVSAYRDPAYNRGLPGAARDSMHIEGLAADIPAWLTVHDVRALGIFSGIGDKGGIVQHVDLRHLSAKNRTPHATPANPARWHY